ncbi:hypothetical protein UA08_06818 [Talaromyces atroroseus]|uniref:Uncharacterized protein n=1 Tax=Talaromyces atroroseus TaxID=1441469 RepID=A0A225ACI7_TALAT|nr:hypothetical protein UA08_06818 [Talaromyces atroroseus]OKL58090.1 hypothetical protein UA08_06818 [Talaromyces atroroseus]
MLQCGEDMYKNPGLPNSVYRLERLCKCWINPAILDGEKEDIAWPFMEMLIELFLVFFGKLLVRYNQTGLSSGKYPAVERRISTTVTRASDVPQLEPAGNSCGEPCTIAPTCNSQSELDLMPERSLSSGFGPQTRRPMYTIFSSISISGQQHFSLATGC